MTRPSHFPLPITVEEVTSDWLTAALRTRAPGVTVLGSEVVDVLYTTTTKIRMRLTLDEAGRKAGIPELVIIKGGFQDHARELDHMHLREVRGYRDVFPEVPLPHPDCYFADFDAERRQGIIIMEDLVVRGVTFCNALRPQSYAQMERRLSALAAFHARTWESPLIAPGGKLGDLVDFFDVMQGFFEKYVSPENWSRLIASPRGAATSVRFHDRDWMVEAWTRMRRFSDTLPRCALHGDMHLGNLYEFPDGTPGFFDTLASTGPAMLEVSYHMSASVDMADRAAWEEKLVRHYLSELTRHGATPPSLEEAMHQYVVFLLYGMFIWLTTESHYQPESVNTANSARMSVAMLDHDAIAVLDALPCPDLP